MPLTLFQTIRDATNQADRIDAVLCRVMESSSTMPSLLSPNILGELLATSATNWAVIIKLEAGDSDPQILFAGRALESFFGYINGGLIGKPLSVLVPPDKREKHKQHIARFVELPFDRQMGETLRMPLSGVTRSGELKRVAVALTSEAVSGDTYVVATVVPVPDTKVERS